MKKQLIAALLIFVLLLTATGCAPTGILQHSGTDSTDPLVTPAQTAAPSVQTPPAATGSAPMLTPEQAQQIALDYLGVAADQVTRLRTEYEIDDGIAQYDVQFFQGDWEYEFEISAEDGRILSYDKDHKYD